MASILVSSYGILLVKVPSHLFFESYLSLAATKGGREREGRSYIKEQVFVCSLGNTIPLICGNGGDLMVRRRSFPILLIECGDIVWYSLGA